MNSGSLMDPGSSDAGIRSIFPLRPPSSLRYPNITTIVTPTIVTIRKVLVPSWVANSLPRAVMQPKAEPQSDSAPYNPFKNSDVAGTGAAAGTVVASVAISQR